MLTGTLKAFLESKESQEEHRKKRVAAHILGELKSTTGLNAFTMDNGKGGMNMDQRQISDDLNDIHTRLHALETLLSSPHTAPDVRDGALTTLKIY